MVARYYPTLGVFDQAARFYQFEHEVRNWLCLECKAFGGVHDLTSRELDLKYISGIRLIDSLHTFQYGQANVQRVAVEDTGEASGDNATHTRCLDGKRCVFTGGATAEVGVSDYYIARLHPVDELTVDVLHAVTRQLIRVRHVEIARRDDDIGIDISAELVYLASQFQATASQS